MLVLTVIVASTRLARADEADPRARSRALFVEGVAALEDTRPKDALSLFQRAYELFPHWATHYNIGVCHRSLGHHAAAATSFSRYLEEGGAEIPADERTRVSQLLAAEEARTATLTIEVVPEGELRVDGQPAQPGKPVHVDPGDHLLEATAPGHTTAQAPLSATSGQRQTLTITLRKVSTAAPEEGKPRPAARNGPPTTFWFAAGTAALGLATFGVGGALAVSENEAYKSATSDTEAAEHRSNGVTLGIVADVGLAVGIVGAAIAAFIALQPHSRR